MSFWLSSPVTSSRWLHGVVRWSFALGGGYRRGGGSSVPPHIPSKQTIVQVMVQVDAERRAAGLPVPMDGQWQRLRRKHGYGAVAATSRARKATAASVASRQQAAAYAPVTEAVVRRPVSQLARQLAAMDRGVTLTSSTHAAGSGQGRWQRGSGRAGSAAVSRRGGGLRGGAAGRWA